MISYYFNKNHKVDIDCGVHYTGITTLLNLDTFDEQVIIEEGVIPPDEN